MQVTQVRPALLCVTPSFGYSVAPHGAAALLAFLRRQGCDDFGFVDFRHWLPLELRLSDPVGAYGETFVVDVPELPWVLTILRRFRLREASLIGDRAELLDDYSRARNLRPKATHDDLRAVDGFFAGWWRARPAPKFVGFTTWSTNYVSTLIAAARLKMASPDTFVVAGGPQVSESLNAARLGLAGGVFDAVVVGEGEQALADLYAAHQRGALPLEIPRVLWPDTASVTASRSAGPGLVAYGRRSRTKLLPLEHLPVPDYRTMNLSGYRGWRRHQMLPYQLSRGCTDKCSFCSEWVFWERYRSTPAEVAVEQAKELKATYGARHLAFTDSLLNGHPQRLHDFAEGLLRADLKVTWSGFMRAQMDTERARLLRRAGCTSAFIGVESMSDETLELMNKRRSAEDNASAIEVLIQNGIAVEAGVIPGFPGDSMTRFTKTVKWLAALQEKYAGMLSINSEPFRPSPNQPIYAQMDQFGLTPEPWPNEVLDIEPALADIASRVHWRVVGANQGLDRLGESAYVTASRSHDVDLGPHWGPPQVIGCQPGAEARATHVGSGWFRVTVLGIDGGTRFLLMDQSEVNRLAGARRGRIPASVASGATDGALRSDDAEAETATQVMEAVARRHLFPGDLGQAPAPTVFSTDDALYLSPHWAGRLVEGEIRLLHCFDDKIVSVPASTKAVLVACRRAYQPASEVVRRCATAASVSARESQAFVTGLIERGVLGREPKIDNSAERTPASTP